MHPEVAQPQLVEPLVCKPVFGAHVHFGHLVGFAPVIAARSHVDPLFDHAPLVLAIEFLAAPALVEVDDVLARAVDNELVALADIGAAAG